MSCTRGPILFNRDLKTALSRQLQTFGSAGAGKRRRLRQATKDPVRRRSRQRVCCVGAAGELETHLCSGRRSRGKCPNSNTQIPHFALHARILISAFALTSLFSGFISSFLKLVYDPEYDRPGKTHAGDVGAMAEFVERW